MSIDVMSPRESMHETAEKERGRDLLYQILCTDHCTERDKLTKGICSMIREQTSHPAITELVKHATVAHPFVQRAIIIAALVHEPDFLQFMIDRDDICSSTVSEYVVVRVPQLVESLLDGNISLQRFVLHATHMYVTL